MNIAIDYDDTISAAPEMFRMLITTMAQFGHKVYVVTYRPTDGDNSDMDWLQDEKYITDVLFTSLVAKKKYCEEFGINIDIWIDDCPQAITHSFTASKWFYEDVQL